MADEVKKDEKDEDLGLGLADFLSETPSPEDDDEPGEKKTPDKPDKPEGDKDKKESKEEEEEAAKAKKALEKPDEKKPDEKKPDEKKPDEKKPDEKKPDEKPVEKPNWDSDENPFKSQYKETRDFATRANQKASDLERENVILKKKADGTYDEEKDGPRGPSAEQLESDAVARGRSRASRIAADAQFGKEDAAKDLDEFHEMFGEDPHMQARILASDLPAVEAIKVVRSQRFFAKYGSDPEAIVKKIQEEGVTKLTEEITKKVTSDIKEKLKLKKESKPGLSDLPGASTDGGEEEKPSNKIQTLDEILQSE